MKKDGRFWTLVGALVLVAGLFAAFLWSFLSAPSEPVSNAVVADAAAAQPAPPVQPTEQDDPVAERHYVFAVEPSMLGMPARMAETVLRSAGTRDGDVLTYTFGSCRVEYRLDAEDRIEAIEIPLTGNCEPGFRGTPAQGASVTAATRFSDLRVLGAYRSPCLADCPGGAPPSIARVVGPGDGLQVEFISTNVAAPARLWLADLGEKPGAGTNRCFETPPGMVETILMNVRIDRVRIGRNLARYCTG